MKKEVGGKDGREGGREDEESVRLGHAMSEAGQSRNTAWHTSCQDFSILKAGEFKCQVCVRASTCMCAGAGGSGVEGRVGERCDKHSGHICKYRTASSGF